MTLNHRVGLGTLQELPLQLPYPEISKNGGSILTFLNISELQVQEVTSEMRGLVFKLPWLLSLFT